MMTNKDSKEATAKKQIAKKPIKANRMIDGVMFDENEYTKCPCCTDYDVQVIHGQGYCHRCGQRLKWSDENAKSVN